MHHFGTRSTRPLRRGRRLLVAAIAFTVVSSGAIAPAHSQAAEPPPPPPPVAVNTAGCSDVLKTVPGVVECTVYLGNAVIRLAGETPDIVFTFVGWGARTAGDLTRLAIDLSKISLQVTDGPQNPEPPIGTAPNQLTAMGTAAADGYGTDDSEIFCGFGQNCRMAMEVGFGEFEGSASFQHREGGTVTLYAEGTCKGRGGCRKYLTANTGSGANWRVYYMTVEQWEAPRGYPYFVSYTCS